MSVRMNVYILETIRIRAFKFEDTIFKCLTQIKNLLDFGHASFRLQKTKKLMLNVVLTQE